MKREPTPQEVTDRPAEIVFQRILVACDFSAPSLNAFDRAVALASWCDASLRAMHVSARQIEPSPAQPADVVADARPTTVQSALSRLPDRAAGWGVALETVLRWGRPVPAILAEVEYSETDLLVVGTRGGSDRPLGPVAEELLERSSVPILTVSEGEGAAGAIPDRIVCAVDFSYASLVALERALSLAQEAWARVVLLHVMKKLSPSAVDSHFTVDESFAHLQQQCLDWLRWLVPADTRKWSRPEEVAAVGDPVREILHLAEEQGAQLIVMGNQGRGTGGLTGLGSTARRVTSQSRCPVLVVPAHANDAKLARRERSS